MRFFCPGVPVPKGSKRAFYVKKLGRAIVTEANSKTRPWEQAVRFEASEQCRGHSPTDGPVLVSMTFWFQRPKSHLRKDGSLRPSAKDRHQSKPDIDKLARSCLDAMSGLVYFDDAQVSHMLVRKAYVGKGQHIGVEIDVIGEEAWLQ